MPVQPEKLFADLRILVGDLAPADQGSVQDLELAQSVFAQALNTAQKAPLARPEIMAQLGAAETIPHPPNISPQPLSAAVERTLAASSQSAEPAQPEYLAYRRELPVQTSLNPASLPNWAAGRAVERTLGPFIDSLNRPVWIDLFRIEHQVNVVRSHGAAPILSLPVSGTKKAGNKVNLGPGSLWFAAQLLANSAPNGGYAGLKIKGGTLEFNPPIPTAGNEIIIPPGVTCTIKVQLDPPAPPTGGQPNQPGVDARDADVVFPKEITLTVSGSSAALTSQGDPSLQVYGASVRLKAQKDPVEYSAAIAALMVPFQVSSASGPAQFSVSQHRSTLFAPQGSAPISRAAWVLPVSVTDAATLGAAAGVGALGLFLAGGLSAAWMGQSKAIALGDCVLLADSSHLTLLSWGAKGFGGKEIIPLWSPDGKAPPSSQLIITYNTPFALEYFSDAAGSETILTLSQLAANFDRPLTLDGSRVPLQAREAVIAVYQFAAQTYLLAFGAIEKPVDNRKSLAFDAANLVIKSSPAIDLILFGQYDGQKVSQGAAVLGFLLQQLLPTLPDPYAANFAPVPQDRRAARTLGVLIARVDWQPAKPTQLRFFFPQAAALPAGLAGAAAPQNQPGLASLAAAPEIQSSAGGILLLDVSTNADWLGVRFGGDAARTNAAGGSGLFVDSDMYLHGPGQAIQLLTVPEVQWEPVSTPIPTPDDPTFPTPMSFPDSGGPSILGVQTVQLVPVAPLPALADFLSAYNDPKDPRPAFTRFTLPFGIIAFATLRRPEIITLGGQALDEVRPNFSADNLLGGHQISIRALESILLKSLSPSTPSLPGYTIQLRNGLYFGLPSGKSILDDDVDTIFNNYFGPGQHHAQVPVTRIDLSGYGESLFSDWRNPEDAAAVVSQARFDVIVGRTAFEVIQVRSILYPYAVRVVRTITIQRLNNGAVIRQDSGWQAASEGRYLYPDAASDPSLTPSPALTTHPGVVSGIRGVTNIRDTGQTFVTTKYANQMMAVRFDGNLDIEGVMKGAGDQGVPARGQLGFVQLSDTQNFGRLDPDEFAELIQKNGPLGGPVDCAINIGGSGQLMRVTQVGVGPTQGMGGYEFAMTAWGSPHFPQGGQWSFFKQNAPGDAPQPIDPSYGVPLIRAGAAPTPPPVTSPYRFADPADLAQPDSPLSDYGILHATGTQRVFFPRPKIEAAGPQSQRITSTQTPALADPYTLAAAVGFFPRTADALPFPGSNWALAIDSSGNLKLELPSPTFPVPVGQRTIANASSVRTFADYTSAVVELAIDTANALPWSFRLSNVGFTTSSASLGDVMQIMTEVDASAAAPTQFNNSRIILGGALSLVQDVMEFLQDLGIKSPFSVSMTNQLQLKAGLKVPFVQPDGSDFTIPPFPPGTPDDVITNTATVIFDDAGVTVTEQVLPDNTSAEFEIGATALIHTQFHPLKAVGLVKLNIKLSTQDGTTFTLTLGAGLGVQFSLGPFDITASVVVTQFLVIGDTTIGLGEGLIIKGSVDLKIVTVDVSVEAKMAILKVTCPDTTIWGAAQVTFALEITIAFVIDIDFEVQSEWDANLSGGPCALPDVL